MAGLTTPSLNDMSFLMSFTLKSIRLTVDFFDVQGTLSGRAWTSSSCTTLGCRHALGSRGLDKTAYATSRDQIQQNAFSPRFPDLLKFHQSPGGVSSNMFLLCVRNRLWSSMFTVIGSNCRSLWESGWRVKLGHVRAEISRSEKLERPSWPSLVFKEWNGLCKTRQYKAQSKLKQIWFLSRPNHAPDSKTGSPLWVETNSSLPLLCRWPKACAH